MLPKALQRFTEKSPITAMAGAVAARLLSASRLNDLFERVADVQYTRKLTFGALFDLMSAVVCGVYPSVHRAWRDAGSVQAVYEKLDGMEPIPSGRWFARWRTTRRG